MGGRTAGLSALAGLALTGLAVAVSSCADRAVMRSSSCLIWSDMACIWAIMACFISMSLLAPAFMASMWVFIAASAASFLAMLSVMEVFILAIGSAATEGAGVTAGVSGVAVTVAEGAGVTAGAGAGAATTGAAGAGGAMGSGADAGAAAGPAG